MDSLSIGEPQAVGFVEEHKVRKIFPSSHREGLLERLGIAVSQNGGRRWSRFPMETLRKVPSLRSELNFTRGAGMIKSDRW